MPSEMNVKMKNFSFVVLKNERAIIALFVFLILLLRFSAVFLGFHPFDMHGCRNDIFFYVAGTKYIADYPNSVSLCMGYWLTFITSHILTDGSLLQLRILGCLIDCCVYSMLYYMLKDVVHKYAILFGLLCSVILRFYTFREISYNGYSVFFITLSVLLLYRGLNKQNNVYVFLSSIFIALNVYVRLPNILEACFIVFIPLYFFFYGNSTLKESVKKSLKPCGFYITGYIAGLLLGVLLLVCFGHFNYYVDFIKTIFAGSEHGDGHSSNTLLLFWGVNNDVMIKIGLFLAAFSAFIIFLLKKEKLKSVVFLLIALFLFKKYVYVFLSIGYSYLVPYSAILAFVFWAFRYNRKFLYWIVFSLLLFEIYQIGSSSPGFSIFSYINIFAFIIVFGGTLMTHIREYRYWMCYSIIMALVVCVFSFWENGVIVRNAKVMFDGKFIENTYVKEQASDADNYNKYTNILRPYVEDKPVLGSDLFVFATLNAKPFAIFESSWMNPNPDKMLSNAYDEQKEMPVIVLYKNDKAMRELLFNTDFVKNGCYREVFADTVYHVYCSTK